MLKKAVSVLKYTLTLVVAFLLLYLAFRNIDFVEFWDKAGQVDYTWVILSILLSLLSYYARAYRWNILLKPLGYSRLSVYRTSLAILVGYLANLAFPRLGEVTRCGMLHRSDEVPMSASFGTVITERIIDLCTLILLILVLLMAEYDRFILFMANAFTGLQQVEGLVWKALVAMTIGSIVAIVLFRVLYQRSKKVREFIKELVRGILSVRRLEDLPGFFISTAVLWVTYYFMSYIVVFSLPETAHLSWMAGLMLLVTGGLALALPVQGGIGTYHAFVSGMLVLYAVDKTTGVFLATLLHTSQIVAIGVFGGIALIISVFLRRRKARQHKNGQA